MFKSIISAAVFGAILTSPAISEGEKHIDVAEGYSATVFADKVGLVRHLITTDTGWVYGALMRQKDGKGLVALKDTDGDGVADVTKYLGEGLQGTGIDIHRGYLYFAENYRVVRFKLGEDGMIAGEMEAVVNDFPRKRGGHAAKIITFDDDAGHMYVNVGAPSNACMKDSRTKGSPGMTPCPILEDGGGVWKFDAGKLGQDFTADGKHYATGIRNAVALEWNDKAGDLYLAQHGRDQLHQFFPEYFNEAASHDLPSEEFHRVGEGADIGWPYSYYDQNKGNRMVMPEYGGDGNKVSDKGQKPLIGFPGHWGPNDLIFTDQGALIAFHGSWNRAGDQRGYKVVFVPMDANGNVAGEWSVFADGFTGVADGEKLKSPRDAVHRPTGLAEDTAGNIFISSAMSDGRIWKVSRD